MIRKLRKQLARPFWWLGNKIHPCRWKSDEGCGYYEAAVVFHAKSEEEAHSVWDEMNEFMCDRKDGCILGTGSLKGPLDEEGELQEVLNAVIYPVPKD